jgi:hypothetical protein
VLDIDIAFLLILFLLFLLLFVVRRLLYLIATFKALDVCTNSIVRRNYVIVFFISCYVLALCLRAFAYRVVARLVALFIAHKALL